MKESVLKAIEQFSLLECGDCVTVALSGGADSVALLHLLYSLKDELGIKVNAAHFNHSIRGKEAERDQNFARAFCEKLGVEFFTETTDVPKFANDNHLSLELAARKLRYEFLERVATDKIATAHTASDNLETLIFNLTRGTALKGLCGIPPKRDRIIRPVIFCTREDIENYCRDFDLEFVTDSTNLSDDYSRNKIRHNVIPVLKELNSNVEISAVKTASSLSEDDAFLRKTAADLMFSLIDDKGLLINGFNEMSQAVAKRIIIKYFAVLYPEISLENRHINEIYSICIGGVGKVNLPKDMHACVKNGFLNFCDKNGEDNEIFNVKITEYENVNNLFANNLLDCDKIIGKPIVRTREAGDKIRLYGSSCTKTLKKLFTEYKIPLNSRKNLPVIADDNGVLWVHNIGVASRCAVSDNTERVLKIEILSGGSLNE